MTHFAQTSSALHRGWLDTGPGQFLACIHSGMSDGRAIASRFDRLSRMSRSELARHGLSQRDISRAALNGF